MIYLMNTYNDSIHFTQFSKRKVFKKAEFRESTDNFYAWIVSSLVGCKLKANCLLVGPRPIGGMPSMGVFLRDHNLYLCEFRRKPQKTPNG